MALVTQTFSDIITFTRASSATYFDATGTLQTATTNTPRFDYNPSTLAAQGLLIEEARTNLALQSEDFTTTWAASQCSVSANVETAPDGTLTADKIIVNVGQSLGFVAQAFSFTSGASYSFSVYVKAGGITEFRIVLLAAVGGGTVGFDLSSETVTIQSGAWTSSSITPLLNGWFRVTATMVSTATVSSSPRWTAQGTGDGTSGIYIWGAQIEAGAFPTSYIPTVASTVTRAADVASVNTLSPWYNAAEGTLYAESICFAPTSIFDGVAYIIDGTSPGIGVGRNNADSRAFGNGASINQGTGTFAQNVVVKQAAGAQENNFALSTNGSAVASDLTTGPLLAVTTLSIGAVSLTGGYLNGWIRRITYYPRRLSNAELQALTS